MTGRCLWCGCPKSHHDGRVAETIRHRPDLRGVRWSTTACSSADHPCRTYEPGGRTSALRPRYGDRW